jgi:predicted GNAT family acetyltransferase
MQENPIYKFLKENNLTTKDEGSFLKEYSDPNKAKELHGFLVNNNLTTKDEASFYDTYFKKKNLGGIASSPTELPLQGFSEKQIGLLKKGVEKPAVTPIQKKVAEISVPTNLPKQEALAYENELKLNDVAVNTLTDIYKKKGLKFDPSKPAAKKQIQEYVDKSINGDLTKVTGKDGKEYLVRGEGFLESGKNSLVRSVTEPVESAEINFTSNPEELSILLDKKIQEEPNIPESAPSGAGGYFGELAGGLPKMVGLMAIPYAGEALMVGEVYFNALANQRRVLYERGIKEGMDKITAAKKAMDAAPLSAIPDALVAAVMAKGVGGPSASIIPNAAKQSFIKASANAVKGISKVSAIGGFAEYERSKIQQRAGYNVKDAEAIENGLRGAGDYALMDAAFKLAHSGPKAVTSAAKNLLSSIPTDILKSVAKKYPNGERVVEELPKFVETKAKVQDFVPEEKVASVTGLTEKTDNLKLDIQNLEEKKKGVTPAIAKEIDSEIFDKNKEIEFYDNQIKKVLESKDETGISEEVDDVTGLKIGEQIIPREVKVTEDIEAQKDDIEKRRKEDLDKADVGARLVFDRETSRPLDKGDEVLADKMIDNIISKAKNIDEVQLKIEQLGYKMRGNTTDLFNEFVENRINGKTTKTFAEWRNEAKNNIENVNAKYDAELDALEKANIEKERQAELDDLKKGIPAMITKKLESDLKQYGFTDAEINKMTPIVANETLIDAKYKAKLSSLEEVKPKAKPAEVDLTSPEKMNASQNRYGIVKDGKEAGFIVTTNPENNVVKIKGVTVNEGLRGKGLAGDAYVKLGESLSKEGISLESDSFDKMEPSATRVWEKLSDKGLAIKGENSYRFNPLEVKPIEQKVTIELLSSEEPPQKQGETIVTLSGKTETERLESIDRRKRETKVSDKVVAENDLIQDAESYFKKDGRYKNSSEGRNELNNLRIKARELGLEIDTDRDAVTRRNKAGRPTKVSYNNKADGEAVVDPNGRTITERSREVQDAFEELTDAGVFLDVETELGKRMSASQIDAAVKDILDGIPSKRAEKYLNALEKAIAEDAFPLYDKTFGDIAPKLSEIRDQLGIEREVIGEPMDEVALNKFLDEESRLTPEEEQTLLDNVENLLNEYETTQEGPQGEVQPIEARAEEGIPAKTEPVAEAKAAGEAPKPVKEVYDEFSSKKSELAKKKIINDNFDTIVEDLIKNKKIERIC